MALHQRSGIFTHLLGVLLIRLSYDSCSSSQASATFTTTTYTKHAGVCLYGDVVNHTMQVAVEADCAQICTQLRDECDAFSVGPVTLSGGGGGNSRRCELARADGNATVSAMRKACWTMFLKNLVSNEPMSFKMFGERLPDINYSYSYKLILLYCNKLHFIFAAGIQKTYVFI